MTLPNFIIAGAIKAGTTSLFNYLGQHPQVYTSPIKETRYFAFDPSNPDHVSQIYSTYPVRTMEEYLAQFAGVTDELAIGEATPRYLISPCAPANMKAVLPDVRLIYTLRNPVERLYSIYMMRVTAGFDVKDVYYECRPGGKQAMANRYSPYFERWLRYYDRSQMKIVLLEDLKSNPKDVFQSICRYLAIDDSFEPDTTRRYNVGGVPKNRFAGSLVRSMKRIRSQRYIRKLKPFVPDSVKARMIPRRNAALVKPGPLPEDLAEELRSFYRDDVLKLQKLLGIDLSVWGLVPEKPGAAER